MSSKLFFLCMGSVMFFFMQQVCSQNIYKGYLPESDTLKANEYCIRFYNNNFVKNNEYFGPYTEGITYIGSILQPEIQWQMSKDFSITGGWYLRQFYGRDGFQQSLPVIRAQYEINSWARLVVGQFDGRLRHGLIEAIYSPDQYFLKNPEYGVQLLIQRKQFDSEIFMDWERFLLPGEAHKEVITGGLVSSYKFNKINPEKGFSLQIQAVIHHMGGQVDILDAPMQTRANIAGGARYAFLTSGLVKKVTLASDYIRAMDLSPQKLLPVTKGYALHQNITIENKWVTLGGGWFHGDNFFAPLGDNLFQSISQFDNSLVRKERDLVTFKFLFEKNILRGVYLGIRYETYYDLQRKWNDFVYGLNITVNGNVFKGIIKSR